MFSVIAKFMVTMSFVGCHGPIVAPIHPAVIPSGLTRCDPARLGWAAEGSPEWNVQQHEPVEVF